MNQHAETTDTPEALNAWASVRPEKVEAMRRAIRAADIVINGMHELTNAGHNPQCRWCAAFAEFNAANRAAVGEWPSMPEPRGCLLCGHSLASHYDNGEGDCVTCACKGQPGGSR